MKFGIITNKYPRADDYYRNGFIHQRNLKYIEQGYDCKVFIFVNNDVSHSYIFEGIKIVEGNYQFIKNEILNWGPDRLLIHFMEKRHMEFLKEIKFSIPTTIWIHGVEALKWNRRLFNLSEKRFLNYIIENTQRLRDLRIFYNEASNLKFIFVSNWMKNVMEKDVGVKIKEYRIIPNVINTELFKYKPKNDEMRKKILLIRSFNSRKYANDIAVNAILELKNKDFFEDLEFCIYGQVKYFEKLTKNLLEFENVKIFNRFLSQKEISTIHESYGVFLCPTRQDSQGVSMCEAMSSGLVPITSNNTAIPEFLDSSAGYLTNNKPKDIAKAIENLYFDSQLFKNMSYSSHQKVFNKCNEQKIINEEIEYILK